jgi:serine protease Do
MIREFWKSCSKGMVLGLGFVLAIGAVGLGNAAINAVNPRPSATLKLADPNEGPVKNTFAPVVKKALPTVVNISSSKVVRAPNQFSNGGGGEMDPLFRQFFGEEGGRFNVPKDRREQSLGSGVIVSPEGYILTNSHVVDGATDVKVTFSDKRELKAAIIGTDPKIDIAVLKVEADNLPYVTIGDSSKVQVGDFALAIGNPFGVGQTVTMGIVSALGRSNLGIEAYEDFIQTDAPINPGNSGGALVNERGELVGINTAILSHGSGGNQGIGFAVPMNLARQVMDQLLKNGKVTRAYLGIVPQDVTPAIAKAFNVKEHKGALVGDVTADGPAAKAGVEKGDVILEVNGTPVTDSNQLRMSISMMVPDTSVKLKVMRSGSERELAVKLGELEPEKRAKAEKAPAESPLDGVSVEDVTPQVARQLGVPANTQGVVVSAIDPASPIAASGLRRGDIIQEVNRKPVKSSDEFAKAIEKAGKEPVLLVNRRGNTLFVAV